MFEATFKRVLRAVFGGGSDISVPNPLPVSQAGIDEGNPLPVGGSAPINGFESHQWHGRTLNSILTGRYDPTVGATLYDVDIDNYKPGDAPVVVPPNVGDTLYLYSRRFFKYPQLFARALMADRTGFADGSLCAFEFQGIGAGYSLRAGYYFRHVTGANNVYGAYTDQAAMGETHGVNLAAYLPADYMTAVHRYICKLNKGIVEYRIDDALVLAVLYVPDIAFYTLAGPPYDIRMVPVTYDPCEAQFHLHLEDTNEFTIPGFSDGEPLPLRAIPLYTTGTNTQWKALATAGAVLTSHPVPVWGYPNKTLYFQADAAGTLDIQFYLGGGWRTARSVVLAANTLEIQVIDSETPLIRCVYTPTNADTITLAEVHLS